MEPSLQRRVQRYGWDKAAAYYESSWQDQLKPAHDLLFELAKLKPGEKLIDVACGTGLISFRALEEVGSLGLVLGTDISDKMVAIAENAARLNKYNNIRFERMDAEELSTEANQFEVALCALGLMYVPDPDKAMSEMFRVLKPNGRCVAAVWGKRSNCGWADIFEIVDKRVASEVCPMFYNLGNDNMLMRSFTLAGFKNVDCERISTRLIYNSDEEACSAAFEGGPVALAYNKFPENVKVEARQEYLKSIEKYKENNVYAVPGEFVVGMGFKNSF